MAVFPFHEENRMMRRALIGSSPGMVARHRASRSSGTGGRSSDRILCSSPVITGSPLSGSRLSCMSILLPLFKIGVPDREPAMQSFSGREVAPPREIGRHPLDLSNVFVGQLVPEPECEDLAQVIGEAGHSLVDSVAELVFEKAGLWRRA